MALAPTSFGTSQTPPPPAAVRPLSGGACPDLDDLGLGAYPVGDREDLRRLYSGLVTGEPMWRRSAGCR